MRFKPLLNWKLTALAVAVALSACGGGDDDDDNPLGINAVKVVGDSLSDSGTFAGVPGGPRIASVQGSADEPHVLWVERIAKAYDVKPLCPVYKFNGQTFTPNPQPGCTNYAIGGARINNPASAGGAAAPLSIVKQLQDAGAAGWSAKDLVLVDGGGNDAADLVGAYLAGGDPLDATSPFGGLVSPLLDTFTLGQQWALGGDTPEQRRAQGGTYYMQALADHFVGVIKAQALDKGAKQVVVANIPTITYTPRFQAVLAQIEGAAGAQVRAQSEALFKGWISTFNQRLAANFSGESRVQVIDLASRFADQVTNPARYGLSNATLPVCGAEWITVVPHRPLGECTAAALSATTPPPGAPTGASWWQRFMFSDGFHPTPYGHQLFAEQVMDVLDEADWY